MTPLGRIRTPTTVALVFVFICLSTSCVVIEAKECYSCEGEGCIRVATAGITINCTNTDDLCYTEFDTATLLPIKRGCLVLSQASSCTGNSCVSCSTDDLCNEISSPLHQCVVCSSLVEANCLANPASLTAVQCPAPSNVDLTAAQCYSSVIGNVTERGCITSQTDVDSCTGLNCATCTGTGCNNAEFPTNRIQCVQCDNADSCDADATTSAYCDDVEDVCVTLRRANGNVMKSCKKAMATADVSYCDANPSQCNFCGQNLCNGAAFNASAETKSCYQCEGNGCLKTSVQLMSCQLTDDSCFSMFDGFNPSRRGCSSELSTEEIAACTSPDCLLCSESECNLVARADHRCLYCSSVNDTSCIDLADGGIFVDCPAPTTDVSDAQCYIKIIGKAVTERGCISSSTDLASCSDDGRDCATCSIENDGAGCNKALFPSDRRRCTVGTTANTYCPNPWDDCVQLLQSGTRKRTCRSSLTTTERSFCANTTNRCYFCSEDNCNAEEINFNYIECLSCDSSTDVRCATNPSALSTFEKCDSCASALIASGGKNITRRGCLASLPTNVSTQCTVTEGSSCLRCSTNRCNAGNFPADRLQCYRCVDPPCISHQTVQLEYCPEYQSGDSCLVESDSSGQLFRLDCRSSLSATEQSACAGRCQMCNSSGCNDPQAYSTSGSCVQCRSSLNSLCRNQALQLAAEPCNDPTNSQCYSRLVDGVTERGCMSDLGTSAQSACLRSENCLVCSSSRTSNCNTIQYPVAPLACYQCDSTTDGDSCRAAQTGNATECPTYSADNKCYTIVQSNGDTVRKCSTAARDVECGSLSTCEVCLFSGCNRKVSTAVGYTEPSVSTTTPGPTSDAMGWTVGSYRIVMLAAWMVCVRGTLLV